jgi:putative ABC transport system ATP-binding protein
MPVAAPSQLDLSSTARPRTMIALESVTKQFNGKRRVVALDRVTLAIDAGDMVSIIGPSGSGKSTLLNLMGGLDRPTSGTVSVDGAGLIELSDDELAKVRRDKIGFIFQFFDRLKQPYGRH